MSAPAATMTREEWLTLADSWTSAGVDTCYICGSLAAVFVRPKIIDTYQMPHCRACRDSVRQSFARDRQHRRRA